MRMNILATGGAGYVGSHTAKALARSGYQPIVLDNLRYGHREAVKWGPLIVGDLADLDLLRHVFRSYSIGAVIHFAAFAYVGESMRSPSEYFRNNVVNTLNLLDTMREHGVDKIVFSSSCATYGYPQTVPLREDHPQTPISPYGESKLMVERLLKWYGSAYSMSWTALRYFNAAGADPEGEIGEEHDPETHLIPNAIAASLGHKPALNIFGTDYDTPDGTAVRDYVHVSDLATAHVQALTRAFERPTSEALNLGTGSGHSVRDVVAMIEKVGDRKVPVIEASRREGDPPTLIADATNAARVLGWTPRYSSLKTIVETAWRWHARPLPAAVDDQGNAGRDH
jgi:UDP-arabinose 4-epimerase